MRDLFFGLIFIGAIILLWTFPMRLYGVWEREKSKKYLKIGFGLMLLGILVTWLAY